jgi:hypothetical protein
MIYYWAASMAAMKRFSNERSGVPYAVNSPYIKISIMISSTFLSLVISAFDIASIMELAI